MNLDNTVEYRWASIIMFTAMQLRNYKKLETCTSIFCLCLDSENANLLWMSNYDQFTYNSNIVISIGKFVLTMPGYINTNEELDF